MPDVPQLPRSSDPAPARNPNHWVDLIAFLAVLALGGALIALGHITAGSLATVCAALAGLYGVWKHVRSSNEAPPADEPGKERREDSRV
jgi:hypothetical protein